MSSRGQRKNGEWEEVREVEGMDSSNTLHL